MTNKLINKLGIGALGLILVGGLNAFGQNADKEIPCLSDKEIEFIVSEIPKYFKQKSENTYLIEFVPEAKKGYNLGGQLSVYIPVSVDSAMSIFDRTDIDPSKWYSVGNWDSKLKGCASSGIYLNIHPAKHLSKEKTQKKFNESIYKIKKIIKEKQNEK